MFPASKVRRATELKAPFLQCDKYFHTLSLNELHGQCPQDLPPCHIPCAYTAYVPEPFALVFTVAFCTGIMPPDNSADFDVHLERSLRDLSNLRDNLACDIFMVYSAADIPQIGAEDKRVAPRKVYEDLQKAGFKV